MTSVSLEQVIAALRAGNRETARAVLAQLREQHAEQAEVWLWSAAATEDADQKETFLHRVLAIEPQNSRARAALQALGKPVDPASPATIPAAINSSAGMAQPKAAATIPTNPFAAPRLAPTGVRTRRPIPWALIALLIVVMLSVPLTLWLI